MLNRYSEIRAGVKLYIRALPALGAENFIEAGKARKNHLGGRVTLPEGFTITGTPVSCREEEEGG